MVTETRAVHADLTARAKFAAAGETIRDTRWLIAQAIRGPEVVDIEQTVKRTASRLAAASADGFVEVG